MNRFVAVWMAAALVVAGVASGQAQETAKFETTLSIGATMTDGNSETLQANAALIAEGERDDLGSVRAGIEGNYGEATVDEETDTTVENAKLFGNAKKTLSEKTFAYVDATLVYDGIADIDYRFTLGPGLGVYLVKNDSTELSASLGVAYVWEKVGGIKDDYPAVRVAERLEHTLSATAKMWESVEYIPQMEDLSDYLLNAEIGIEAAISSQMNLRLVLKDTYDSVPALGLEHNDVSLIAGISVNL